MTSSYRAGLVQQKADRAAATIASQGPRHNRYMAVVENLTETDGTTYFIRTDAPSVIVRDAFADAGIISQTASHVESRKVS